MFLSFVLYLALLLFAIGLISVVWPLRFLRIRSRGAAGIVAVSSLMAMIVALVWPPPAVHNATGTTRLDEIMPAWQMSEEHAIHVAASPEKTFAAIRDVRADEIALSDVLTWIGRGGRSGPESILNAPASKPLLEVATRSGFLLLADEAPRELVFGVVVAAPREVRGRPMTAELFGKDVRPGMGVATMNFLVTPDGRGGSNVTTETRVYVNDRRALRVFAGCWRVIHPGSDIIRRMWLRAVRTRAEA